MRQLAVPILPITIVHFRTDKRTSSRTSNFCVAVQILELNLSFNFIREASGVACGMFPNIMSVASSMHLIFVLSYYCFVSCNEFSGNTTLTVNLLLISALMGPNLQENYFHHFNVGDKFQVIAFSDEESVGFRSTTCISIESIR